MSAKDIAADVCAIDEWVGETGQTWSPHKREMLRTLALHLLARGLTADAAKRAALKEMNERFPD